MSKRLAVILIDRFADWEHGFATAVLRDYLGGSVAFHTPGGAEMTSEGGMRIRPDGAIADLTPDSFDGLAIIGSGAWGQADAPDLGTLLRGANEAGRVIGAICMGTLAAARAGLLDARPHTSNDLDTLKKAPAYRGEAHFRAVPHAVRDSNLITAAGYAPRSFGFELLSALLPDRATDLGHYRNELTAERFA